MRNITTHNTSNSAKFLLPNTVQPYQFKQLLQEIEQSNTSTYKTFVLSNIPSPDINFYGKRGSQSRKDIHQILVRLKRRSISKYLAILEKTGVTPSTTTYLLKQNNNNMAAKLDEDSVDFSLDDDEGNITSDYEEEENETMKVTKKLETMNLKAKASPVRDFSRYSVTKTPIRKKFALPPTPPRSLSGLVDYSSVQASIGNYNEFAALYGIVDPELLVVQYGTKSNPYITFVDAKFPERYGGMYGFEVSFVSDIQHNNFKRQGYKIRANITPMDYKAFKMTIPSEDKFPHFFGRCTLLKGPSRVFWHRKNELFEEIAQRFLDAATESAFQRDTLQVQRDETRQHAYRLFVFPVDTLLDNNIFSGASNQVKVDQIPLKLAANHTENKFSKQMNEFGLMWTIGVKGGEELADYDVAEKVDYSKLF